MEVGAHERGRRKTGDGGGNPKTQAMLAKVKKKIPSPSQGKEGEGRESVGQVGGAPPSASDNKLYAVARRGTTRQHKQNPEKVPTHINTSVHKVWRLRTPPPHMCGAAGMFRATTRVVSRVPKARSQRGKQTPGKGGQGKTPKHRQVENSGGGPARHPGRGRPTGKLPRDRRQQVRRTTTDVLSAGGRGGGNRTAGETRNRRAPSPAADCRAAWHATGRRRRCAPPQRKRQRPRG
jgi:hypothetical protein